MDEVNFVALVVGRCVDGVLLLLNLVIRTLCWLLRFLSSTGASLHVDLSGSTLAEYCNFALYPFLSASEAVSSAACGALDIAEGWAQTLGGVFESFKMVGHLSCHVAWRIKDVLHRGLVSGSCLLRQTFEGLCIGLSLVLYFFNTLVNLVLICTQNCLSGLVGIWEVVADPVNKAVELTLTLLTFLYGCLVGASVLLFASFQLLLDFLGGLGRVFFTVIMVDSNGLLITAAIVSVAFLLLNPRLPFHARRMTQFWVSTPHSVPAILEQALANQEVQGEVMASTTRRTGAFNADSDRFSASEASQSDSRLKSNLMDGGGSMTDAKLISLLKEQEERKKCVICQDLSKTVLLLPCRHLCLCRHCTDILTQRRLVKQRCCPLCRKPISQTMDVFL